ncbi:lysoplasmalogenase [Gordonia sp. CPCC 205515]|uniref:lysoplasmalogenase n=1 Tax=Gordonia sp. CPCC 205515 TaxID=3140791 RepID=UPI003AF3E4BD
MTRVRLAFWVYATVALIHVLALTVGPEGLVYSTKLLLMPLLAVAVVLTPGLPAPRAARWLLLAGIGLSWLGDGAAFFFPFADELPPMLLCFGLAHIAYITLFARYLRRGPLPRWSVIYGVWWVAMVAALWPHLGGLAVAVAAYGLVLGGTAVLASACGRIIAWGGAFFLVSDTILSLRLFVPDLLPESIGSPAVMATYALGQGLIAWGAVRE